MRASAISEASQKLTHEISVRLRRRRGLGYVLPAVSAVLLFSIFPLLFSLVVSFFSWNLLNRAQGWQFVGLGNYINALTDARFQLAFLHTVKIAIPALALEFAFGLGLALLLNRRIPGRGLFVSLLVVPILISPAAVGTMWRLLFGVEYGAINGVIQYVFGLNIAPDWLGNPKLAIWSIAAVDIWQWTPFVMMLLLAGLSNIPDELYEAARVDGATPFRSFLYITLPLLRLPIIVVLLMRMVDLLKLFGMLYVLTEGGPGGSTETITFYTYFVGLRFLRIGDGAAMSFLIVILATIIVMVYLRIVPLRPEEAKNVSR
jgi:multiple sugar transport system permease protein